MGASQASAASFQSVGASKEDTAPRRRTASLERGIPVPMRDGTRLATDLFRPRCVARVPALLLRTPYDRRNLSGFIGQVDPLRATDAGMAFVSQDVRGCYESAGRFAPLVNDGRDGLDTAAWICRQPWSNGQVGMAGASYLGAAQLLSAVAGPGRLRAIAPMATSGGGFPGPVYTGGALHLGMVATWIATLAKTELDARKVRGEDPGPLDDALRALLAASPLERVHELVRPESTARVVAGALYDWVLHDRLDEYWEALDIVGRAPDMRTPALHISGWFDSSIDQTLSTAVAGGSSRRCGGSQHLLVGPWTHARLDGRYRELDLGPHASADSIDLVGEQMTFLRRHLLGLPEERPPVRIFVMGRNRWRDLDRWPPSQTDDVAYYLHSRGRANGRCSEGSLSCSAPSGHEPPDVFLYDPGHPVPTVGGPSNLDSLEPENAGPRDQGRLEDRFDVLFYSGPLLTSPLEVTGTVRLQLFAATSCRDTDFTAKLVDLLPSGRALAVCEGILRARYRASMRHPTPVEPNMVIEYSIKVGATSYVFDGGHRIGLQISSSSYPRFDPNPNTHRRLADGPSTRRVVARQMVFHDGLHPSRLVVPVWSA
jgi:uncharacterized protein